MAFAHSSNAHGDRHELASHLRAVAELAGRFGAASGAHGVARCLGLWHDLGKYDPAFQRYLLDSEAGRAPRGTGPDHKAAGAALAAQHLGLLALAVQGHHGGVLSLTQFKAWLAERMRADGPARALRLAASDVPELLESTACDLPDGVADDPHAADLMLRLVFGALVDADYLDTERHFLGERSPEATASLADLWERLDAAQADLSGHREDPIGRARHAVYQACLAAAERPPGVFRLTVPTGGGKTRSAMAFALQHALRHGQERVVVAIPFISITEQTADVYRSIFEPSSAASRAVLEHHSAANPDDGSAESDDWARLAAENWDAPIVVTTTVQLFESLFSNRPGKARKLHRLANSVIILDEAQSLPPHLLQPILDVLLGLTERHRASVVFSTATQPAFQAIPAFARMDAVEIVPNPERFYTALRRVRYVWRTETSLEWSEVAAMMAPEAQALAVVNTKRDAFALLDALDDPDALHLSTLLCGAHRRQVIAEVRRRLADGEACRLVSTQVVEAGVDLDFPVVLRALAPLDAIIQAAGRCNREGRLPCGRVVIFDPREGGIPPGVYTTAAGVTRALLGGGEIDLHGSEAPAAYFSRLYETIDTDGEGIQALRAAFDLPGVAERFRMISEDTESVVVPYGSAPQRQEVSSLLEALRARSHDARRLLRSLQPYVVNVRSRQAERYRREGLLTPLMPGLGEWLGTYHPVRGLTGLDPDPEMLVI